MLNLQFVWLQNLQLKAENIATDGNCDQQLQILQPDCNWTNYTTNSCKFCNQNICSVGILKTVYCTKEWVHCTTDLYCSLDLIALQIDVVSKGEIGGNISHNITRGLVLEETVYKDRWLSFSKKWETATSWKSGSKKHNY